MLSIHTGHTAHAGPPGSSPVPAHYIPTLRHALHLIQTRIVGHYQANKIFKALPGKKTFSQMFNNHHTWVNYDPKNNGQDYGWTMPGVFRHDIVICQYSLRLGHWSTAGTIVHELAHLNGADGASHAAENTLRFSGLKSPKGPYDPMITG